MSKDLVVSVVGPVKGREDEFSEWYEGTHIPEVLALDGYNGASRYAAGPPLPGLDPGPVGFMTIFEVDDADKAVEVLAAALGGLTLSDSADMSEAFVRSYRPARSA